MVHTGECRTAVVGIIPARFGSSRLPGKPLATIAGKPMIQRVYEQCRRAAVLSDVVVATDDRRIADVVAGFGGKAVLTRVDHVSGTDRIAEALGTIEAEIVVNVKGDQPFINPIMIDAAVGPLLDDPALDLTTLMCRLPDTEDLHNPSVVKVVTDLAGNALYFSRSLIPYPREAVPHGVFEHVGTYVYRRSALMRITQLPPTVLEQVESLEQLRWLEHGLRIRVVESQVDDREFSGFSVDTPEDLARAEEMLRSRGLA